MQITREELIGICRDGLVPQERWTDRDSARAQMQLGQVYALLSAGCEFHAYQDGQTLWVSCEFRGFSWFEGGVDPDEDRDFYLDREQFYLPTRERLTANAGGDWY